MNDWYYSIILGLIIGFIIGIFFKFLFLRGKFYHGPVAKKITANIYQNGEGKCYKFITRVVPCPLE